MRVLIWLPPMRANTGGARRMTRLADALGRAGADVLLAVHDDWIAAHYSESFPTYRLRGSGSYASDMRARISPFRPEVCVARNVRGLLSAAHACREMRLPLVWDIGIESRRMLARPLLVAAASASRRVVTQHEGALAAALGRFGAEALLRKERALVPGITPPVIDVRSGLQGDSECATGSGARFLVVGSICRRKGQLAALQAFRTAFPPGSRHGCRITFVGDVVDAAYAGRVHALARDCGNAGTVTLTGWSHDVPALMADASVLVVASTHEGVPNVVQEAMWLGRPVLAMAVGGVPQLIRDGETGWLVPPGDVEGLARRMRWIADHPEECRRMGDAARVYAEENFSVDAWATSYREVLVEAIADR